MKPLRILATLVLLAATAFPQAAVEKADYTVSSAGVIQFNDGIGSGMRRFEYIISGAPATASIVLQACMRGGTCATLETSTATTNSTRQVAGIYDFFTITPTFTGGTAPKLQVFMTAIPRGSDAASSGGTLAAQVQGTAATGAATVGSPVLVGGKDSAGNAQPLAMNTLGAAAVATRFTDGDGLANTVANMVTDTSGLGEGLNIHTKVFNGTLWDRMRSGPSAQTGAAPIGLVGVAGSTVTYSPSQLGVNALAYGSGGTSAASTTIDLRGAKSFTLTFQSTSITTLNEIIFAEDGTTSLVTLSGATGCAAATQALINQPEAGNAATAQGTCTIGTLAKFPLRAVAFTWTNTNATAGSVTGRMFVGY